MGLVAAAVVATMTLERFEPRLVCMSGICGGVSGDSEIYDLLVTQICHQHDACQQQFKTDTVFKQSAT
jgi:nucleoside phosphorylase